MSTQSSDIKTKTPSVGSDDLYTVLEKSLDDYFSQIKINAMTYLQAVSDLQQEIIQLRKNNANNLVNVHKTISKDFFKSEIPQSVLNMMDNLAAQGRNTWNFQNHLLLMSIETLSKNIQAFNENAKTFSDIHQQLLSSWASIIKQKYKESQE